MMKYKNYEFTWDKKCWKLTEDVGNKKPLIIGYWPKLWMVLREISEQEAGNCEDLSDLQKTILEAHNDLKEIHDDYIKSAKL